MDEVSGGGRGGQAGDDPFKSGGFGGTFGEDETERGFGARPPQSQGRGGFATASGPGGQRLVFKYERQHEISAPCLGPRSGSCGENVFFTMGGSHHRPSTLILVY